MKVSLKEELNQECDKPGPGGSPQEADVLSEGEIESLLTGGYDAGETHRTENGCERLYILSGNSKTILLTFEIGLGLVDLEGEPFSSSKKKKMLHPKCTRFEIGNDTQGWCTHIQGST